MTVEEVRKEEIMSAQSHEWKEIELTVDSGACEAVMPKEVCSHIEIQESEASRKGVEYEVASGSTIVNLGEKVPDNDRRSQVAEETKIPNHRRAQTIAECEPASRCRI